MIVLFSLSPRQPPFKESSPASRGYEKSLASKAEPTGSGRSEAEPHETSPGVRS